MSEFHQSNLLGASGLLNILAYCLIMLLSLNAVAAFGQCILQFATMLPRGRAVPSPHRRSPVLPDTAFVSVHVPTHEEPPHLVIATLEHLARMRGADFEVLVIDNNTRDQATWRPVRDAARRLGPRFHFHHFDDVAGAKAGALNLALGLVDPRTTHIAIVDADYQVDADFLADAVSAMATHAVDYVQFPQSYRGVAATARGVERELGDYFACFAAAQGRSGSLLPTGTLSVFTRHALESVGGWSAATITEDADIGVRLHAAGRKGLWLARSRGVGLLPLDFDGLQKQRARWVAGNIQVLRSIIHGMRAPRLTEEQLVVFVQLTAWVSLWLLPAMGLALAAFLPALPFADTITALAAGTILGSALLTAARMFFAMPRGDRRWRVWHAALTTKLALTWTAALAWLPALTDRPMPFNRTLKEVTANTAAGALPLLAASLLFLAAGIVHAFHLNPFAATACALLAAIWPCSRLVDANLRASARAGLMAA